MGEFAIGYSDRLFAYIINIILINLNLCLFFLSSQWFVYKNKPTVLSVGLNIFRIYRVIYI